MTQTLAFLGTAFDLLLVVLGFGLIIFIHELGHFIAARWAGIRVLAFAVGFGPAVCSFRKGMGFRSGTSEPEYLKKAGSPERTLDGVSPTEYRLNLLPFGGYVKMLGQEDTNPGARSAAPDSYQSTPPWKRMIVISAGVVMNLITAAALFVIVFLVGLKTEPPIIGGAQPGSPAATAVAVNAPPAVVDAGPGLRPGDKVTRVNGRRPNSFNDLVLATAMARGGDAVEFEIERPGVELPLYFQIVPSKGDVSGLLELGVEPARSAEIVAAETQEENDKIREQFASIGFGAIEPGMELVAVEGREKVINAGTLFEAIRSSNGEPVTATFKNAAGEQVSIDVTPRPELQVDRVRLSTNSDTTIEHLLGLTPVMSVGRLEDADGKMMRGFDQGLREGDIFARLGGVEFPSIPLGISEIRAHAGKAIAVSVLRRNEAGAWEEVQLSGVTVDRKGAIGFGPNDTSAGMTLLALPPRRFVRGGEEAMPAALDVIRSPGLTVAAIAGRPVANFGEMREALRAATREAFAADRDATVTLGLRRPVAGLPAAEAPVEELAWEIPAASLRTLHQLEWSSPLPRGFFKPEQILLKAETPAGAIGMGLAETRRVMLMTYVTFARLFEGTVRVEHLKGPVGIAHLGTIIADKGLIWLMFFMALISVNLAVINFLPLPIVDGGQFLFIVYEQVMGKPVSVGFQNAATLAGLVLIGSLFIIVTFNDVVTLFNF